LRVNASLDICSRHASANFAWAFVLRKGGMFNRIFARPEVAVILRSETPTGAATDCCSTLLRVAKAVCILHWSKTRR